MCRLFLGTVRTAMWWMIARYVSDAKIQNNFQHSKSFPKKKKRTILSSFTVYSNFCPVHAWFQYLPLKHDLQLRVFLLWCIFHPCCSVWNGFKNDMYVTGLLGTCVIKRKWWATSNSSKSIYELDQLILVICLWTKSSLLNSQIFD